MIARGDLGGEWRMNSTYFNYKTLFGIIVIESNGTSVTSIKSDISLKPTGSYAPDVLTDKAAGQLNEYFTGKRERFDVPLSPFGTDFQCLVWDALLKIPFGETRSYKQIAQMIGKPGACRAVGLANNRNPIWIMIPCHRVIGSDGSLTGYGGGLDMKRRLLELESRK